MSEEHHPEYNNGKRRITEVLGHQDATIKRRRTSNMGAHNFTLRDGSASIPSRKLSSRKLSHEEYTIGWICALSIEMTAARAILDEEHVPSPVPNSDSNIYTLGSISGHNVVIACLPAGVYGTTSAATVGLSMQATFPNSKNILFLVGIGGGVPSAEHDIRLGDVAVSMPTPEHPAVKQYNYGKIMTNGMSYSRDTLNKPATVLLNAVARLRAQHDMKASDIPSHISIAYKHHNLPTYTFLGTDLHVLYQAECEQNVSTT